MLKVLKKFIIWKYLKKDIDIHNVGVEFINDFEFYLKSERKVQHISAMGDIKNVKKIILMCVANRWLERDPDAKIFTC